MWWGLALALVLSTAACSGRGDDATPPGPTVSAAPSVTARQLEPGTRVEFSAAVTRVLGERAFVVADADLPAGGQVVVSEAPVTVRVTDLVTVSGRVESINRAAFARYGVTDAQVIQSSGGVVVVASSVRFYLPVSPVPTPSGLSGSPR